jgi:hypothetical protein
MKNTIVAYELIIEAVKFLTEERVTLEGVDPVVVLAAYRSMDRLLSVWKADPLDTDWTFYVFYNYRWKRKLCDIF